MVGLIAFMEKGFHMPFASRPLMLMGVVQGLVLWFLWHAADTPHWPENVPMLMGALLWVALAVPAATYLSENAGLAPRRRKQLIAGVAVLYLCLGAYAGWLGDAVGAMEQRSGAYGSFAHILAALVLGFILVPLAAGRENGRWDYQKLFQLAWRNALLSASVVAITGLFWAVLFAGAMLMKSLGLAFVYALILQPVFAFPVTGMVVGAVFAQGHARAELLTNLRHYWLTLNAWLLPLLLGFGVMWVTALPVTGLDVLLGTHSAAFILFWFAALAVLFINCAWQDGLHEPAYPRWLAGCIRYAWATLPVVAAVAGWALWLRIEQYGLTEERIWAVFIWVLVTGYAVGYGLSLLPPLQRRLMPNSRADIWMGSLGSSNIFMAIITLACLGLLASPVADPRRLAVNDQVARLLSGQVEPADFDYAYLRWRADRWGMLSLQQLAHMTGDARRKDIAGRARQSLEQESRWGGNEAAPEKTVLTREEARQRIGHLQADGRADTIPDDVIDFLRTSKGQRKSSCLHPQRTCALWMQDFNADGQQEALVITGYASVDNKRFTAELLAQPDGRWQLVGEYHLMASLKEWEDGIRSGKLRLVQPDWNDVELNGQRRSLVPSGD
jgi:hypothetical protein